MKFALSQRLALPGKKSVQCIVAARREFVTQEPEYTLRYMTDTLDIVDVIFAESVVIDAQPQIIKATRIENVITIDGPVASKEIKKLAKAIKRSVKRKRSKKSRRSKR